MQNVVLYCENGITLVCIKDNLVVATKKKQEIVPIKNIQSLIFKEPKGRGFGSISFKTAQSASAGLHLGFGFGLALGADYNYFFTKTYVEEARQLRDYIMNFS